MSLAIRENPVVNIIRNILISIIGGLSFSFVIGRIIDYIKLPSELRKIAGSVFWNSIIRLFNSLSGNQLIVVLIAILIVISIGFALTYFLYYSLKKKDSFAITPINKIGKIILFIFSFILISINVGWFFTSLKEGLNFFRPYIELFKLLFNSTFIKNSIQFIIIAILGGFLNYKLFKNKV